MSDLVYEDDKHKILATDKGVQISRKGGAMRWVQYDHFLDQNDEMDKLEGFVIDIETAFSTYPMANKDGMDVVKKCFDKLREEGEFQGMSVDVHHQIVKLHRAKIKNLEDLVESLNVRLDSAKKAGKKLAGACELIQVIANGPGYPLDDCPKCHVGKQATKFINDNEELFV